jgi:putative SOS response-associated peptidase YedK
MCGRIALYTPPARLARFFEAQEGSLRRPDEPADQERPPSWNVAPSTEVWSVVAARGDGESGGGRQRLLVPLRWGLVPFFAKDPSIGNKMANARAESVETKPAFRRAFERRRCLVVADGFYEWRSEELPGASGRGKRRRRQPFYFQRADGAPLAFAGLWESWRPPEDPKAVLRTCTIITTDAGPDVAWAHDRMPVVVEQGDLDEWLGIDPVDPAALKGLLAPSERGTLVAHRVDPRVNRPEHDDPSLVEPCEDDGEPASASDGPDQLTLPLGGAAS